MDAHDAITALEDSPLREALPESRFCECLTDKSINYIKNNVCMPPDCLAEVLEWAASDPKGARKLAATLKGEP